MQKTDLLEYLEAAKRHVGQSKATIDAQKHVIATLAEMGKDATEAKMVLQIFERMQNDDLFEVERILSALESIPAREDDD